MKNYLIILFLIIFNFSLKSQTVSGIISDEKETLVGATVISNGKGTVSNIDGKYSLKLNSGQNTLQVKYFGYKQITIDLNLKRDTVINFVMTTDIQELETFTVVAKSNKESIGELISLQSKSASVVDGASAESFKKTPDSKASDVFKRISGATVQDGKFVVIRGLNDRYNYAMINDSPLPSSESDRRAFSFDIFPSNMIDAITINKTSTPDNTSEFSGGIINIKTTEPKDTNYSSIGLNFGYGTITTFKNFGTSEGGKFDLVGLGSKTRQLPTIIPNTQDFQNLSRLEKSNFAKSMNWNWSPINSIALPNTNLQFGISRYKKTREGFIGFYTGFNWARNLNTNTTIRRDFEEQDVIVKKMELKDSVFSTNIFSNLIFNTTWDINQKNTIKFKNLLSLNSEDRINSRSGVREIDNDPRQWERATNFWYQQNLLLTSQLNGQHEIGKSKLNWNTNFSQVERDIPNLRRIIYRKYSFLENDTTQPWAAVIQSNGTIATAAGNMFWSKSLEKSWGVNWNFNTPFKLFDFENQFKFGTFHQFRIRDFSSRNFGFSQYKPQNSQFDSRLLTLGPDEIFSQNNLGLLSNGMGGFKLDEATNVDDSYNASSKLNAGFLMLESKIKNLRFIGGLRAESYNQNFNWIEFGSNKSQNIDTTVIDILPSINLIYSLTEKSKLRMSYSKTVSRPEFRELAPFSFYNFIQDNIISGDPNLKRCKIENWDLRWEFYPKNSQIITISSFLKDFNNPIEMINRTGTSGAPELYFRNINRAKSFGMEFETRLNLTKQLNLYTNGAWIFSKVDLSDINGTSSRPLQGQSPYIINCGLFYTSKDAKNTASINWNYIGPRIFIVGNVQEPTVWEMGRHLIDFQISRKIVKGIELKLNVKDALAQRQIYFQDLNGNQKFDNRVDNNWQQINFGSFWSLGLKWTF